MRLPKESTSNSFKMAVLLLMVLIKCSIGQNSTVYTVPMENAIKSSTSMSTVNEGITPDKYITYMKLNGTSVELPIQDLPQLNKAINYTVMLWFKPQGGDLWGTTYQYAFEFENSLACYFTPLGSLMCDSISNCDKLIATGVTSAVEPNEWAHISITGRIPVTTQSNGTVDGGESHLLVESNQQIFAEDQKNYVVLYQTVRPFTVCLGGCNNTEFGFIGGIREFVVFNTFMTKDVVMRLKNQYIAWDKTLLAYYRFTDIDFSKDFYQNSSANVLLSQGTDYSTNDICYPPLATGLFHKFSTKSDVSSVLIDKRWTPKPSGWSYSVQNTLYINSDSCYQSNPYTAQATCFLTLLQDSFMIFQPQPNEIALFIFNDQIYNQLQSASVFVPQNQWLNIQVIMSQYKGYQIQVFDLLGRLISQTSEKRDLLAQNVRTKQISIFAGYRGLVKTFALHNDTNITTLNESLGVQIHNNCIAQLHFSQQFLNQSYSNMTNKTSSQVTNICNNSVYGVLKFNLSVPLNYVGQFYANSPNYIGQPAGQSSTGLTLFDGMTCNSNQQLNQMRSTNSYFKAKATLPQGLMSATVEFWFKTDSFQNNATAYLFQLWAQQAKQELFSISFDSSNSLFCTPFSVNNVPKLAYADFSLSLNWVHISCSFDPTGSISGSLFYRGIVSNQEFQYSGITSVTGFHNETFDIYMGNNMLLTSGTPSLILREVRIWAVKREYGDIQAWRQQMIDPRAVNGNLLSYFRFNEGSYIGFNFASISNNGYNANVTFMDIEASSDSAGSLIVCPLDTYFDQHLQQCYSNPIVEVMINIYPVLLSNQNLVWVFDSSNTQYVNSVFRSQYVVEWEFEDDLIAQRYIATNNLTKSPVISIPSTILRDETYYQVKLNISNSDYTQSQVKIVKFVPISCQYYGLNGGPNISASIQTSQSSQDITFTIDLKQLTPYCEKTTFFNQLLADQFTFDIVPKLAMSPNLTFQLVSPTSVQVTLQKDQQYMLDTSLSTNFQIVVDLKLTNNIYSGNVDSSGLTFQNLIYTVGFNQPAITQGVQLVLNVLNQDRIVLRGENAIFDASQTYISNSGSVPGNLSYHWICPAVFGNICHNLTSRSILSISNEQEKIFQSPYSQFFAINGQYQVLYTFILKVQWTKPSGINEYFETYTNATWVNVYRPVFNMSHDKILVTAPQTTYNLTFNDQTVINLLTLYDISWSIIPNITDAINNQQFYGMKTSMIISQGGFLPSTSYSVTVFVNHFQVTEAWYSETQNFTTLVPPSGGQLNPVTSENNTILTVVGWVSLQPPMSVRIWESDFNGIMTNILTNDWVPIDPAFQSTIGTNVTFTPTNINPVIVQLTDGTGEVATVSVVIYSSTSNNQTTQFFNQYVISDSSSSDSNYTLEQQQYRATLIQMIAQDVKGEQKNFQMIASSLQLLEYATQNPEYMTIQSSEASLKILTVVESIYSNNGALAAGLANSQSSESYVGILANSLSFINYNKLKTGLTAVDCQRSFTSLTNNLTSSMCNALVSCQAPATISTPLMNLTVQKIIKGSQKSILMVGQFLIINATMLAQLDLEQDANFISTCITSTVLDQQMFASTIHSEILPYSTSLLQYFDNQDAIQALQQASLISFPLISSTFRSNQTVCMGLENEAWSQGLCETSIDSASLRITCKCNMLRTEMVGVFTDQTRILGPVIEGLFRVQPTSDYQISVRVAISMVVLTSAITIGLIFLAKHLDSKDLISYPMTEQEEQLFEKLMLRTKKPEGYWQSKRNDIKEFSMMPHKQHFSILYERCQPFLDVFSHYNHVTSRTERLSTLLLQLSFYSLVCTFPFSLSRVSLNSIDQNDIDMIVGLGISGIILLMPISSLRRLTQGRMKITLTISCALFVSTFTLLFMNLARSPITIFCTMAASAVGLVSGQIVSPLLYTYWNLKACASQEFKELASDISIVRQVANDDKQLNGCAISDDLSFSPIRQENSQRNE